MNPSLGPRIGYTTARRMICIGCAGLGLLWGSAPASQAQPSTGPVEPGGGRGVVLDARTSEYLEGAEVRIAGTAQLAVTDRNGRFEFRNMAPRTTVDLRMEYAYSRRVVPFVQLRNVFNAPIKNTQNGYLLNVQDYLDPKLEFGLRGTW